MPSATYIGTPSTAPDVPPTVSVSDERGLRHLDGVFAWGASTPPCAALAKAILLDHLGDADEAALYHRRFMWRLIATKNAAQPFRITAAQIDHALEEIRQTDQLVAKAAARVAAEQPTVADERGHAGIGLSPIRMR